MARDHPAQVERGLQLKKVGNADHRPGRRSRGPPHQCPRSAASTAAHPAGAACPGGAAGLGSRRRAAHRAVGGRFRLPRLRVATTSSCHCGTRRSTPFSPDGSAPTADSTLTPTSSSVMSSRSTSRTPPRCTRNSTGGAPTSPGRWRATRSTRTCCRRGPRGRRSAGLDAVCRNPFRSIVVRAVEVLYACDEASGSSRPTSRPTELYVEVEPRAGSGCGITRPREACSITVMTSTPTVSSRRRASCRRRRRTRARSRMTCAVRGRPAAAGHHALTRQCEQAIRSYDPCISCATHFLTLHMDRT